jgi:glutathione S-transferase
MTTSRGPGTLRLYDYAASGNCYKVRLALAALGRSYQRVAIDIFDGETLTDEYAAINPRRETPVLELTDGRRLYQSNAILVFLAAGTPLMPSTPFEQAEVVRWLIFEQRDVNALAGLRFLLLTGRVAPSDPDAVQRLARAREALALLDEHLDRRPYLVGDQFTVADIAVFAYTHVAPDAGIELSTYSNVEAWIKRVSRQPRFVEDLEPYPPNARPGAGSSIYDEA